MAARTPPIPRANCFSKLLLTVLSACAAAPAREAFSSPAKPTFTSPLKRRAASPEPFELFDAENVDPNSLASPSKRTKGLDGDSISSKPAKFSLSVASPVNNITKRKTNLSLSVPTTSNTTPITHSRGSPKHKRIGLLNKQRRFSSSPFRRIDPPSFKVKSAGLPFSIDAALSGTISSYKPKDPEPIVADVAPSKAMPKAWFFDIYEETPEEEAANLMEHSASTLDISSDDDNETRRRRDLEERGKENVPPPDFVAPLRAPRANGSTEPICHKGISNKLKAALKAKAVDAMLEDRAALGELDATDFYPVGVDVTSTETVTLDEGKENVVVIAEPGQDSLAVPAPAVSVPVTTALEIIVHEDVPQEL